MQSLSRRAFNCNIQALNGATLMRQIEELVSI